MFRNLKLKILQKIVVFAVIFAMVFSFPNLNPIYEIPQAEAAHCTVSPCTITLTETDFTVPAGVTSLDITMWGGGATGGIGQVQQAARGGGGGGGGAYTACTVVVTAETVYTVTVGAEKSTEGNGNPSSFVGNDGTCTANGGSIGSNFSGGAGGTAQVVAGIVTAAQAGGAGGNGVNSTNGGGGGGGEGAATTATGNAGTAGSVSTGGAGGTGAGTGGDGGRGGDSSDSPVAVASGVAPGGGGGGAGGNVDTIGAGARGEVTITWEAVTPADLSWDTGATDFEIWAGATATTDAVNTWDNGTLICSTSLTDDNTRQSTCGSLNKKQKYRIQAVLKNVGGAAANMNGAGDFVDHVNVKTFWAGTNPTISAASDCGFDELGATDDGASTCNVAFNGNDVRITNIHASGNIVIAATTGTEGFMYLITTDSNVSLSDSSSYMDATIDSVTEDSSRITIGLKRVAGNYIRGLVKVRGLVKFR